MRGVGHSSYQVAIIYLGHSSVVAAVPSSKGQCLCKVVLVMNSSLRSEQEDSNAGVAVDNGVLHQTSCRGYLFGFSFAAWHQGYDTNEWKLKARLCYDGC